MDNFELIERYLQNKMSESERSDFEFRMSTDIDLKTEVDDMRDLIIGIESHGLKNALKGRKIGGSASNSSESESTDIDNIVSINRERSFSFRSIAAAASIAGIFFLGWLILQSPANSEDQLFADAFYTDPGLPTPMSETNNYSFYDAMVDYKMEKYDVALEKWNQSNLIIGIDTLNFYRGMANLNQEKLDQSLSFLEAIDNTSPLYNKANWYKVKILISQGKYQEAKSLLKTIPKTTNPYYDNILSYLKEK